MSGSAPDLAAARAALDAAVQQLTQPTRVPIDRDSAAHPDVAEVEAEAQRRHADADRRLRAQHANALHRRDSAGMRRALARIIALERQRRDQATARAADRGWTPSLLEQLRDAVQSTSGGGGASAGPHRSPIGLAAAELLTHIQRTTRAPADVDLAAHLHGWARDAGHWQTDDPDRLLVNATLAQQWAASAHNLLNPQRPLTLAEPCPECGRAIAHVRDDTGEIVRRAALELDRDTGTARCTAAGCGATWPPERIQLLAAVLEEQARARAEQREQRAG